MIISLVEADQSAFTITDQLDITKSHPADGLSTWSLSVTE